MIGKDLIKCRELFGLSQQGMADMLGYKIRAYQNLEISQKPLRRSISLACGAHAIGLEHIDINSIKPLIDQRGCID